MREQEAGSGHGSAVLLRRTGSDRRGAPALPGGASSIRTIRTGPQASAARHIGIIGNPRSHAYRVGEDFRLVDLGSGGLVEPATLEALRAALSGFAASGVDLLVVQGGDGTVRDVLTALPAAFGDAPPELAILPSGNTNLAARVFGRVAPGPHGLAALARAAQAGQLKRARCRTLRVDWADNSGRAPMRGLFLGAGLYAEGKRLTDARLHGNGVHNAAAVALAVAASVFGALSGRGGDGRIGAGGAGAGGAGGGGAGGGGAGEGGGDTLRSGTRRTLMLDGSVAKTGSSLVFLATTLDRLMLGIWPFARDTRTARGAIRWLDVDAPARNLVGSLLRALLRRTRATTASGEPRSGRADRIALALDGPFVLDGEIFTAGRGGIVLSDGGAVTIVRA